MRAESNTHTVREQAVDPTTALGLRSSTPISSPFKITSIPPDPGQFEGFSFVTAVASLVSRNATKKSSDTHIA
jgi:hypothetical protein